MPRTPTPQSSSSGGVIPTGKQIYDAIMRGIEPDLLSDNLPKLKEQHAGETEEEHAERMQRYSKAFEQYDEAYAAWLAKVHAAVREKRNEAREKAEMQSDAEDEAVLKDLEEGMRTATSPTHAQ